MARNLTLLCAVLLGFVLALYATRDGLNNISDLRYNTYAAETLVLEGRMLNPCAMGARAEHLAGGCREPFASWPPLYAGLIAGLRLVFGAGYLPALQLVNAALWAAIGGLVLHLLLRERVAPLPALAVTVLALINPVTTYTMWYAVTDVLFMLWVLLFFVWLPGARDGSLWRVLALAAIVALACLTRYTGIVLLPIVLLELRRERWPRTLVVCCLALMPLSWWAVRNIYLVGGAFGVRHPSPYGVDDVTLALIYTLVPWLGWLAAAGMVGVLWRRH